VCWGGILNLSDSHSHLYSTVVLSLMLDVLSAIMCNSLTCHVHTLLFCCY